MLAAFSDAGAAEPAPPGVSLNQVSGRLSS